MLEKGAADIAFIFYDYEISLLCRWSVVWAEGCKLQSRGSKFLKIQWRRKSFENLLKSLKARKFTIICP